MNPVFRSPWSVRPGSPGGQCAVGAARASLLHASVPAPATLPTHGTRAPATPHNSIHVPRTLLSPAVTADSLVINCERLAREAVERFTLAG